MNTTKKILVALTVMMVAAAMAAPAVMGGEDVVYSVTVLTGQNTAICVGPDGDFGSVLAGNNVSISSSFGLNNTGDWDAIVEAAFDTQGTGAAAGTYGLVGTDTTKVIPGTEFALEAVDLVGMKTYLTDDGSDKVIPPNLPDDGVCYDYDAHLDVPGSATPDIYSGNVVLTFSNVQA